MPSDLANDRRSASNACPRSGRDGPVVPQPRQRTRRSPSAPTPTRKGWRCLHRQPGGLLCSTSAIEKPPAISGHAPPNVTDRVCERIPRVAYYMLGHLYQVCPVHHAVREQSLLVCVRVVGKYITRWQTSPQLIRQFPWISRTWMYRHRYSPGAGVVAVWISNLVLRRVLPQPLSCALMLRV